jgi:transcription elongation factor GreA
MEPAGEASHDVQLFSTVRVEDADGVEEYTLVRSADTDAAQGRISVDSPVGSALLGLRRGAEVDVRTPGGVRRLTVVDVSAPKLRSIR